MDFSVILNISIAASWMVLAVIVLRLILKKAPKWIHVALWGLVAVRLLMPFSIESAYSLIPSTETVPQEIFRYEGEKLSEPVSIDLIANPIFVDDVTVELEQTVERVQTKMIFWTLNWLIGSALMLLYLVFSYFRIFLRIRSAKRFEDNIYTSGSIDSPFVFGIIKPRICLPEAMDAVSMSYVIAHEQAHIRRRDHWWKPLGFLLLTIHWFNPVIWLAYILLCRDIEMACDERVVRDMGEVERADYSEALLECSVKRSMISACPLAFGEVGVKKRIKSVLHYRKPTFWIVILAVIVCIIAAVCFLTNPMSKTDLSIDEHEWYFERAYVTDHEDNITLEEYQPGLQPKTENAVPMNAVLIAAEEPMWYSLLMGDWDTTRTELHFIHERTGSRAAHYTVELYRNTDELFAGADAVIEPMTDGDGYVLTMNYSRDGYDAQFIFTTEKMPGTVNGAKKLTLEDVIVLSEKQMALTWEDFAEYSYTDVGSGMFVCIYEIDETFYLQITGGSMHGTPMRIDLYARNGGDEKRVDIRRRYSSEVLVEEFIKTHKKSDEPENSESIDKTLLEVADPVNDYQNDIIEQAAESIFGAVTVYASGIDKLEKIPTATVGISEEVLLYRLDYWITKGINGLTGTPPEDIYRESVYFAMFHDWTSDTWTRLGTITEPELDELYNTAPMLKLYGNKYTAAASQMHRKYQLPAEFTAVIKEFDTDAFENGTMALNIVEFIARDDTDRIAELELSEQDIISGYYIHDEDESITTLKLPDDTEFIFFDWWDVYTDEEDERYEILGERWISTRDAELFYEYWLPYADSPGYPFTFHAEEGKVVIKENPLM